MYFGHVLDFKCNVKSPFAQGDATSPTVKKEYGRHLPARMSEKCKALSFLGLESSLLTIGSAFTGSAGGSPAHIAQAM
jgi:hypothetical protein